MYIFLRVGSVHSLILPQQMLRARNIHPEAPSDIVLAAERFVGGEYLKRIEVRHTSVEVFRLSRPHGVVLQDLEAEKTSLISNATIAHPLIPTECWLPYDGSVRIQPSFRETLPIVQSCLHSIIHHALAKCFTLSERVAVLPSVNVFELVVKLCGFAAVEP